MLFLNGGKMHLAMETSQWQSSYKFANLMGFCQKTKCLLCILVVLVFNLYLVGICTSLADIVKSCNIYFTSISY